LFECGASLSASLIEAQLVDEIIIYVAPKLLGASARSLVDLNIDSMSQSYDFEFTDQRQVGSDIRLTLSRKG
jgi:diaminohydroxyphosphoribosylaminopyrimidine deaminase/5-amino-6-(5-phosphoribosylamino)uracil reductase